MEARHKNAKPLKGLELPVRWLGKLPQERGEVERKARGQGGSLATVVVKGGIYHMSVASKKPPAISARKKDIAKVCCSARNSAHQSSAKCVETQAPKQEDNNVTALICRVGSHTSPPYEVVTLNGKPVTKEIDTGVAISIMLNKTKEALFPSEFLHKPTLNLCTFTSEPIPVLGQLTVEVRYGTYVGTHLLYVVKGSGPTLLG